MEGTKSFVLENVQQSVSDGIRGSIKRISEQVHTYRPDANAASTRFELVLLGGCVTRSGHSDGVEYDDGEFNRAGQYT